MFTNLARLAVGTAAIVLMNTTFVLAETTATPAPNVVSQALVAKPLATPKPRLTYRVQTRAYDFTRQNASSFAQGGANAAINQQAFELGIAPHLEYNIWKGLSAGATYFYGNPLNGCSTAFSHYYSAVVPCQVQSKTNYSSSQLNPDDTLPGYQLNTLEEAYLTWKDQHVYVKVGNQNINTPWAPASDGRVKLNAFQGADATVALGTQWQVQGTDMIRFEPRNASDFSRQTLLTDAPAYPGATALASNIYNPSGTSIMTPGFTMGRIGFQSGALTANLYDYNFINIANAFWLDGKYTFSRVPHKPFVQIQLGDEKSNGNAVVGKIDSQIYGVLGGVNINKNWLFTVAYDGLPLKTDTIALPAGYSCSATNTISVKGAKQSLPYFLPAGGTANCTKNANGTVNIYYGGWASPYSYSYATDPLFTTSLTQGVIDRASPAQSYFTRLTFTSDNHKFVAYVNYAGYDYNNPGYAQATKEWNADATYYLNKPAAPGQLYRGFMMRYRYGERNATGGVVPGSTWGGAPLFKYNRFMTEYDF